MPVFGELQKDFLQDEKLLLMRQCASTNSS